MTAADDIRASTDAIAWTPLHQPMRDDEDGHYWYELFDSETTDLFVLVRKTRLGDEVVMEELIYASDPLDMIDQLKRHAAEFTHLVNFSEVIRESLDRKAGGH